MSEATNVDLEGEGLKTKTDLEPEITLEQLQAELKRERESKSRLLQESKKYKEGYLEHKKAKDDLDARLKLEEEDKLKSKGQFDVLLKQRDEALAEALKKIEDKQSELSSRDEAIVNFKKAAAFERELGGKIKKDGYWTHVDFSAIALGSDGKIDGLSLKSAADKFLKDYKELVDFGDNTNLPNHTASRSGSLTHAQWEKLPLAQRRKRMRDIRE